MLTSAAVMFAGIITSLGRINIAVAVLILILSVIFKMISFKNIIFILLIAGAISFISFYNNKAEVTQRIESPAQLSDRDIIYKGAGEILWEHPFLGYGPRTFKEIFPFREEFSDKGISGWHNHILQVYFESGLIGLAVYIYFFAVIFFSGYRFIMRRYEGVKNFIVQGVLLSCAALFLAAFFSSVIDAPVLSIVFVFLVSIMTSEFYKEKYNT
ncbi:MAG: O-antigen ligase family protein [Ignavibacteriales bacterium]|nr:MAG: O-antigen ligase family protein [Ignavibacteriales bacterium]